MSGAKEKAGKERARPFDRGEVEERREEEEKHEKKKKKKKAVAVSFTVCTECSC